MNANSHFLSAPEVFRNQSMVHLFPNNFILDFCLSSGPVPSRSFCRERHGSMGIQKPSRNRMRKASDIRGALQGDPMPPTYKAC